MPLTYPESPLLITHTNEWPLDGPHAAASTTLLNAPMGATALQPGPASPCSSTSPHPALAPASCIRMHMHIHVALQLCSPYSHPYMRVSIPPLSVTPSQTLQYGRFASPLSSPAAATAAAATRKPRPAGGLALTQNPAGALLRGAPPAFDSPLRRRAQPAYSPCRGAQARRAQSPAKLLLLLPARPPVVPRWPPYAPAPLPSRPPPLPCRSLRPPSRCCADAGRQPMARGLPAGLQRAAGRPPQPSPAQLPAPAPQAQAHSQAHSQAQAQARARARARAQARARAHARCRSWSATSTEPPTPAPGVSPASSSSMRAAERERERDSARDRRSSW